MTEPPAEIKPQESVISRRIQYIYDVMDQRSEWVRAQQYFAFGVPPDTDEVKIWRGSAQELANALGLEKHSIYQGITQLIAMDSIRMIVRGYHGQPSVYILFNRPTVEAYEAARERSLVTGRFMPTSKSQRNADAINRLWQLVKELQREVRELRRAQEDHEIRHSQQ